MGATVPAIAPTATPAGSTRPTSAVDSPPPPTLPEPGQLAGPSVSLSADEFVKFYTVRPVDQGRAESLSEISERLLGASARALEVFHLNVGRRQPNGSKLTDPLQLRAGWLLVLPWDAVGDGIQHGVLPTGPAGSGSTSTAPPTRPSKPATPSTPHPPAPAPTRPSAPAPVRPSAPAPPKPPADPARPGPGSPSVPTAPTTAAAPTQNAGSTAATTPPAPRPSATAGTAPTPGVKTPSARERSECTSSAPLRPESHWAYDRLPADQAWGRTRGEGVLVAVIDSGVDAKAPQLNGRVAVGADIPSGGGQGDSDCLGSGTAMAGIVAAAPAEPAAGSAGGMSGLAPAATILPLRVANDTARTKPGDAATAIEVAVSAGARVVTLGAYVDLTDPTVLAAVKSALAHDVVVVAPAPTAGAKPASVPELDGLLLVGGVGPDGQPAGNYPSDTVDVTAPGIDVASLATSGSGTRASSGSQYAAAFVAGAVTLVRSAYPDLSAAQVVRRIEATAERAGHDSPDPAVGWGMINPNAAVSMVLAAETPAVTTGGGRSPLRTVGIGLVVVAGLGAAMLLAQRPPASAEATVASPTTNRTATSSDREGRRWRRRRDASSTGPVGEAVGVVRVPEDSPVPESSADEVLNAEIPETSSPQHTNPQQGGANPPDAASGPSGLIKPVRR
ncbi:S8 family serine peptidase [Micromonospora lupini]|uniref:S8 family serine peptidase n=1 Tax=Micromonospora lupini TaxID=285679 RepID=UPI0033D42644